MGKGDEGPRRDSFVTDVKLAFGEDDAGEPYVELNLNGLPYPSTPDESTEMGEAMIRVAQMSRMQHALISFLRKQGWKEEAIGPLIDDVLAEYTRMYGTMGEELGEQGEEESGEPE